MKVRELRAIQNGNPSEHNDELDVKILLSIPSIGPSATAEVKAAGFGFDWDSGLILSAAIPLVEKTEDQTLFEQARELLMRLATKPMTVDSYEVRRAKELLLKTGMKESDFEKYRHFYHKESKKV